MNKLPWYILLVCVAAITFTFFMLFRKIEELQTKQAEFYSEMKKVGENVLRAETIIVGQEKTLKEYIKNNLQDGTQILKDLKDQNASLTAVLTSIAKTKPITVVNVPSDRVVDTQFSKTISDGEIKIADVTLDYKGPDSSWSYDLAPIEYSIQSTISHKDEGTQRVYQAYSALRRRNEGASEWVDIDILSSEFRQVIESTVPKAKFHIWAPHVDIAIAGGYKYIAGELGFSAMAYGPTKDDNTWRFVRVSLAGTVDDILVFFTPASYNLGKVIPLLSDLWIGGEVGYGLLNQRISGGVSLGSTL